MKTADYAVSSLFVLFSTGSFACELAVFERLAADSSHGITLDSAERVDDGAGYCQVHGEIANSDDGRSRIRFRLRLPDETDWNGRFLVLGNGGTAGMFQGEGGCKWPCSSATPRHRPIPDIPGRSRRLDDEGNRDRGFPAEYRRHGRLRASVHPPDLGGLQSVGGCLLRRVSGAFLFLRLLYRWAPGTQGHAALSRGFPTA